MDGHGPLVDTKWLAAHADTVVIADVRWYLDGRSGREAYHRGHLPAARFVDLDDDLSGPATTGGGRHPLPSPEDFAAAMGRLGIGDDTAVVAYDDVGGVVASRLWWMLDSLGRTAAVLDGGLDAWDDRLETAAPAWRPEVFTARPWPAERLATIDEVDAARRDPEIGRDRRPLGGTVPGRAQPDRPRFGHIPGAVSMQVGDNLRDGRLRPAAVLRDRYAEAGAGDRSVDRVLRQRRVGLPRPARDPPRRLGRRAAVRGILVGLGVRPRPTPWPQPEMLARR